MKTMVDKKHPLFTIGEVGEILGSDSEGDSGFRHFSIKGIKIDSRTVETGDLFVAVKGENHDGHDFIESAFAHGAVASVVSSDIARQRNFLGERYIQVDDTINALGELARYHRARMKARVAAITGSNGKTTVKNILYEILSRVGSSVKSQGNFNNLFGLPLSIFQMEKRHRFAVFELGMSSKGEISRLGEIASPDMAIITNVGPVHLEYFKSVDDIARAKLEILDHIRPGAIVVVNGDDQLLNRMIERDRLNLIRFGLSRDNDIFPIDIEFDYGQLPRFKIDGVNFSPQFLGVHNVYNVMAAFAASRAFGIEANLAAEAINACKPEGMRSEVVHKSGVKLLIDCYNANPVSMKYAMDALSKTECRGRRIAVLGDMLELGKDSDKYHREVGEYARGVKIDKIFGYGSLTKKIVEAFGEGCRHFLDKKELSLELSGYLKKGDAILFKASRAMALEEVVEEILRIL